MYSEEVCTVKFQNLQTYYWKEKKKKFLSFKSGTSLCTKVEELFPFVVMEPPPIPCSGTEVWYSTREEEKTEKYSRGVVFYENLNK
ncbi:hypothetical protein TNIN_409651 [Trichonephila inaurata madagascariensis]|uniref:Uncharacterized protein n=1 Tax=Trichonephila inaurata madagascariensis TaxID=2747483 RepID=A0A8X6IQ18_9ARAC|nr:hypothetical protein TNIN_409651 [Trichonephila inaurata madagascariensis]